MLYREALFVNKKNRILTDICDIKKQLGDCQGELFWQADV